MIHSNIIGQNMQRVRRRVPDFAHRAICVDAEEFQLVADMRVARIASRAVTAIIQRADDHFLALLEAFRIGIHNARHLMPNDPRRADPRVHIAVVADPAIRNAYRNLSRGWRRNVDLIHAKGFIAAEMRGGHGCCHLVPSQETDRGAVRRVRVAIPAGPF